MLGEGDAPLRLRLGEPADLAAGDLRRGDADRLAGEDLLDSDGEVAPRRLAGAEVADAELVVNPAAVEDLTRRVE